jgi:hypothetical protein
MTPENLLLALSLAWLSLVIFFLRSARPSLGCRSMADQTPLRVFFGCLSCEAVYCATQKRTPNISCGYFACKRCRTTVHQWGSKYDFTDWMGPLD